MRYAAASVAVPVELRWASAEASARRAVRGNRLCDVDRTVVGTQRSGRRGSSRPSARADRQTRVARCAGTRTATEADRRLRTTRAWRRRGGRRSTRRRRGRDAGRRRSDEIGSAPAASCSGLRGSLGRSRRGPLWHALAGAGAGGGARSSRRLPAAASRLAIGRRWRAGVSSASAVGHRRGSPGADRRRSVAPPGSPSRPRRAGLGSVEAERMAVGVGSTRTSSCGWNSVGVAPSSTAAAAASRSSTSKSRCGCCWGRNSDDGHTGATWCSLRWKAR